MEWVGLSSVTDEYFAARRVLKNPTGYMWHRRFRRPFTLRFKGGLAWNCDGRSDACLTLLLLAADGVQLTDRTFAEPDTWQVVGDRIFTPEGVQFMLPTIPAIILSDTFLYHLHRTDGLRGRVVVDVGANVGDTPIYFQRAGATVYAYEPDPVNFRHFTEHLALNNTGSAVHAFEQAVGDDGEVQFQSGLKGASGRWAEGGQTIVVKSVSLKTVLEENHIVDPYLLKIDAKGAEWIMLKDPAIGRFERIRVEYNADPDPEHSYRGAVEALKRAGFTQFRLFAAPHQRISLTITGILEAGK